MIFAAIAALMLLAAAAAVALPLWRGLRGSGTGAEAAEASFRMQLLELERDLAAGTLSQEDYRAARRDVEMERTATPPAVSAPKHKQRNRGLALCLAVALMLAAGLLYWKFGNWRVGAEGVEAASVPAVEQMVADLAQRLHSTDADDVQGWEMLGHAYVIMQRYHDAVDAYSHAYRLAGDSNAAILAGYAESLTLADAADFMDKALPLFEKALQVDPRNAQALWYGGLGALERGDKKLAVQRWQSLLAQNPPAEYRTVIEKYVTQAGGSITQPAAAADTVEIKVYLSLAPALVSRVKPDETLFLFAEAPGASGGPPLAVRKLKASDLPLDITLSDQDVVVPGRSLSGYSELIVTARISTGGTPTAQPGDLMGQGRWTKKDTKPIALVIDTVVK
ncbi:MAG TPA: c-type cytochrome biogenesis protein CcmI [Gammaproteobacteria bacterium]|nr:c-type cytochrome biogenesis protein CcmI [Gammaproteobacteria bacterium]